MLTRPPGMTPAVKEQTMALLITGMLPVQLPLTLTPGSRDCFLQKTVIDWNNSTADCVDASSVYIILKQN